MPKRKRNEDGLEEKLARHRQELARMLKVAKGFERQRMAKRQRDPKSTPDKRARIEKEIVVLKSLDLQSVAHAHLCASLLKIKAVAESPKLPEEIKHGVPKPELSEEERAALHNVTSNLYKQSKVREALDKAIVDVCMTLRVPMPDKNNKSKKGDKKGERKDPEEQSAGKTEMQTVKNAKREEIPAEDASSSEGDAEVLEEETEWNGLSDDDGNDLGDDEIDGKEQKVIARFDDRLGSSDGEEYDTANEELDPMQITDESASDGDEDNVDLDESGSEDKQDASQDTDEESSEDEDSDSSAVSPPPKVRKEANKLGKARSQDIAALPSLMGGYISGSESEASDIDMAPASRKNRRGQRARQAIWEKKFKEQAKHLAKEKNSRDAGWDLKRGAVDGSSRTPWKQGIKTPFGKKAVKDEDNANLTPLEPRRPKAPPKKDNEGPLHPSWEARKKAKEQQQTAAFAGKRVVFD